MGWIEKVQMESEAKIILSDPKHEIFQDLLFVIISQHFAIFFKTSDFRHFLFSPVKIPISG